MTARVTAGNPSGVRSFDHTAVAELPEYAALAQALDDLAHAANRVGPPSGGQRAWLATVADMAAALPLSDCCAECVSVVAWPYRVRVENGWAHGHYRCPRCGERWTCGYSVAYPGEL